MANIVSSSREELANDLTTAIKTCLAASGRTLVAIRGDQCPLLTIKGLDSLCGIEVTVDLQERFGVKLEDNIFVQTNSSGTKARTFDQVVDALVAAAKRGD
jgi:acyl carrier protein